MGAFQFWLVTKLSNVPSVAAFMRTDWGWPAVESVHFIGLTLLFGSIAAWDLRLLGMAKGVPAAAFHRLVPLAVLGFAINASSGSLFLMTEPDQYIYNPAFHFKLLLIALAGLNVLVFYLTTFRRVTSLGPGDDLPLRARVGGAASLIFWIGVIICGRLITFYRPFPCDGPEAKAFLVDCILR
jgi:hypothetical protein